MAVVSKNVLIYKLDEIDTNTKITIINQSKYNLSMLSWAWLLSIIRMILN